MQLDTLHPRLVRHLPTLDEALTRLKTTDREAVLLRFYEQEPLAEVGRLLGITEEAARKRVDRAVDKLRECLVAKGITVETGALSAVLLANAGERLLAELAGKVMAAIASAAGTTPVAGIAQTAAEMMVLARVKVAVVTVLVGLTAATSGVVAKSLFAAHQPSATPTRSATAGSRGGGSNMQDEKRECMRRMGTVTAAIMQYAYRHDMHLPPDLGATLPYLSGLAAGPDRPPGALSPQEQAQPYVCPADASNIALPPTITPEWVNQHTSYVYLGDANVVVSGIMTGDRIVVLHHKLTAEHTGRWGVIVMFLDGHGEGLDRNEAEQLIADSRKALEAARKE